MRFRPLVTREILNAQVLPMIHKMLFWYLALHLSAAEWNLWGAEHRCWIKCHHHNLTFTSPHFLGPFLFNAWRTWKWSPGAEQSWVARRKWDLDADESRGLDGWISLVLDKVQTSQKWGNKSRFDGSSSKVNSKPVPIWPAFWSGWTHFLGFMHCSQAPFWPLTGRPWLSPRLYPHHSPYVCLSFSLSILQNFSSFVLMVSHSECPSEEGLLSKHLAVWHWHVPWHVPWHENTTNAVIILCTWCESRHSHSLLWPLTRPDFSPKQAFLKQNSHFPAFL